jgi:hypothetical protein
MEMKMGFPKRILLATVILLFDMLLFFVPLSAIFLAYVVVFNPPWFRAFLNELNAE